MASKMIFLSHIHEERALAILIKGALEDEFGGFVNVFVSSDGTSIPAGANFLKRIERGLVECAGAIYLISPASVKRSWINFELGAVWVRNVMSQDSGGVEIPALPICHSGMTPAMLPAPLNYLNSVTANQASSLEFAFKSLQTAVGGSGRLKTDFGYLASEVHRLEDTYTVGAKLAHLLKSTKGDICRFVAECEAKPNAQMDADFGFVPTKIVNALKESETGALKGKIRVDVTNAGMTIGPNGGTNGANVRLQIATNLVIAHKSVILEG